MSFAGKLAYKYLFKPIIAPLKDNGGTLGYYKVKSGQTQMKKASKDLIIPDFKNLKEEVAVCAVAGKNNWYQMIFCLYSFYTQLGFNLKTVVIDDGTLDEAFHLIIKKQLPYVEIISHEEAHQKVISYFPGNIYPVISGLFDKFVVFKKLFHARILIKGPVLVLDADMLFYKRPDALIKWIHTSEKPVYMYDKYTIYGPQTDELLKKNVIKANVNTGIIGLNNDLLNWNEIENFAGEYLQNGPLTYLMEQALYAMYLNKKEAICLPMEDYEILPEKAEAQDPKAVMHHYPTEYRKYYYRFAWRKVLSRQSK